MQKTFLPAVVGLLLVSLAGGIVLAGHGHCPAKGDGCTGCDQCSVPACQSSWTEKKTKKPKYSMKCDYACERAHECWCTGPEACRCSPPCGKVFVKKKLFKEETEKVEKVPKYEVKMVPAAPCNQPDCKECHRLCWWDPLGLFSCFRGW